MMLASCQPPLWKSLAGLRVHLIKSSGLSPGRPWEFVSSNLSLQQKKVRKNG